MATKGRDTIVQLIREHTSGHTITGDYYDKVNKQAWAELCQAQNKLGLAKLAFPSKKLRLSSN